MPVALRYQRLRQSHAVLAHCLPTAAAVDSTSFPPQLTDIVKTCDADMSSADVPFGAREPPGFRINVGFRRVSGDAWSFFLLELVLDSPGFIGENSIRLVRLRTLEVVKAMK